MKFGVTLGTIRVEYALFNSQDVGMKEEPICIIIFKDNICYRSYGTSSFSLYHVIC
uniref:Uncharacterized protein n=1 Tax=Arundo donax TaxID=35708 RepID=A0A0A9D6D9_ARUDO